MFDKPKKEDILALEEFIQWVNSVVIDKTKEPVGLRQGDSIHFLIYEALSKKSTTQDWKDFAIMLLWRIAERHPFLEGNKRTAFVIGKFFLLHLGQALLLCNDDVGLKQMRYLADGSKPKTYNSVKLWFLINSIEIQNVPRKITQDYLDGITAQKRRLIEKYIRPLDLLSQREIKISEKKVEYMNAKERKELLKVMKKLAMNIIEKDKEFLDKLAKY